MKFVPINFALIKSPINWLIILLMISIGLFAFEEILRFINPTGNAADCGCRKSLSSVPSDTIAE